MATLLGLYEIACNLLVFPPKIWLFKANNENIRKGFKYVQS